MAQEDATLPVRIEVSHPETDEPAWLLEWTGETVTESRLSEADATVGDIPDWVGGPSFHEGWWNVFAKWSCEEVAAEIIDQLEGGGFNARLLPSSIA